VKRSRNPDKNSTASCAALHNATASPGKSRYKQFYSPFIDLCLGYSAMKQKIRLSFKQSLALVLPYAMRKVIEQFKALWLIVTYLILFQTLVLGIAITDASIITAGLTLALLGLTFFMEGLFLGLMPLGESVGVRLPSKSPLIFTLIFAFVLGLLATLAEPAIHILQMAGSAVKAWQSPLLYKLLNHRATELVLAVGAGVALAVALGMLRILYNVSLKPFLLVIVPVLLLVSVLADHSALVAPVLGLASDCGAIPTFSVTVPLVLALGIGVSRMSRGESEGSGFGIVTLASLLPVLAVLISAFLSREGTPAPAEREVFFRSLTEAQKLLFHDPDKSALALTTNPIASVLARQLLTGIKAVALLTLPLVVVLLFVIREKIMRLDEIVLGIVFAVVGLGIFGTGIETGLDKLGRQIGSRLPSGFQVQKLPEKKIVFQNFRQENLLTATDPAGNTRRFFYAELDGEKLQIPFEAAAFDKESETYHYVPQVGPLVGRPGSFSGKLLILLFALLLGYGATLAEPALNALGHTVEDLTVGTFKKSMLIHTVALGVGIGIATGVARIIWQVPLSYILVPAYLLLVPFTLLSSEDYVNIGYDSAGVTTGPITVPLVLSMGLGISGATGAADGFGILASASVFPILAVLVTGVLAARRRARSLA